MTLAGGAQRAHDSAQRSGQTTTPASLAEGSGWSAETFTPEFRAAALARKWQELGGTADDLARAPLHERQLLASITEGVEDVRDSEWERAVRLLRAEVQSGPPCQEAV